VGSWKWGVGSFAANARIIEIPMMKFQIPKFSCILWKTVSLEREVGSWKFCRECTNYMNSNTEIPNSNISMYTKNSAELEDEIFATNARI